MSGTLGVSVAALGYMFLIGRLMVSSLILDALVYDRIGSVSELLFALPGLRRLPVRFPRLARYFDLGHEGSSAAADGAGDEAGAGGPAPEVGSEQGRAGPVPG
jgi:hypothetical protein